MPINILMPALSPTMEKGNLAKWLKKEGDKGKCGDVIAKIVVPEGTKDVAVNDVIAVLAGEGEDVKAAGAGAAAKPAASSAAPAKPVPAPGPAAAEPEAP